jgi:hypothetical protein
MSYKKVSGENNLMKHNAEVYEDFTEYQQPMSFVGCLKCGSGDLVTCECFPPNYTCGRCSWQYITHRHSPNVGGTNISQASILSSAIRK